MSLYWNVYYLRLLSEAPIFILRDAILALWKTDDNSRPSGVGVGILRVISYVNSPHNNHGVRTNTGNISIIYEQVSVFGNLSMGLFRKTHFVSCTVPCEDMPTGIPWQPATRTLKSVWRCFSYSERARRHTFFCCAFWFDPRQDVFPSIWYCTKQFRGHPS